MLTAQQKNHHWYNNETFWYHFVNSNYVTAFTDWFMRFAGKCAELVLYATVIYSCAELYPGVHLPPVWSLTVFLVQMGALDIGGLSLGKLAKQAREEGNIVGATQAARLSKWLIGIMLMGVVTVGVERVVMLPEQVQVGIEIILVVARAACSVLYGKVVHDLKADMPVFAPAAQSVQNSDEVLAKIADKIGGLERLIEQQSIALTLQKAFPLPEQKMPVCEQFGTFNFVISANTETSVFADAFMSFTEHGNRPVIIEENEQESEHQTSLPPIIHLFTNDTPEAALEEDGESLDQEAETPGEIAIVRSEKAQKASTKTSAGHASERVKKLLRANPKLTISEIAKKAKVSRGYASQIRSQFLTSEPSA